ncbi:MAG: HD domain-containing protein [Bdellovibrionales bacterium]|nr:HD domain-containing protein [Bdellovibrionales bacterium]
MLIESVRVTEQRVFQSLWEALAAHDRLTADHCKRVSEASYLLAKAGGLSEAEAIEAKYAGLMHDLGKIGIPEAILNKPAKLDPFEAKRMMGHPAWGEHILRPFAHLPLIAAILPAVRSHHERYDGAGYPDGLAGENIPLLGRIIAIVDTVDAMTQNRAYRKGLPLEVAYAEIARCSGTQFDPKWAAIYLESKNYVAETETKKAA